MYVLVIRKDNSASSVHLYLAVLAVLSLDSFDVHMVKPAFDNFRWFDFLYDNDSMFCVLYIDTSHRREWRLVGDDIVLVLSNAHIAFDLYGFYNFIGCKAIGRQHDKSYSYHPFSVFVEIRFHGI